MVVFARWQFEKTLNEEIRSDLLEEKEPRRTIEKEFKGSNS